MHQSLSVLGGGTAYIALTGWDDVYLLLRYPI